MNEKGKTKQKTTMTKRKKEMMYDDVYLDGEHLKNAQILFF